MEMIKLPSGTEVPKVLYVATMQTLRSLCEKKVMVFCDLVMMCRDQSYEAFGDNAIDLKKVNVLESNGRPHKSIRQIVEAVVKGNGLNMHIKPLGV